MPPTLEDVVAFPLLRDPVGYQPCAMDLTADADARGYWLDLFRRHFDTLLSHYALEAAERHADEADVRRRSEQARQEFHRWLDRVTDQPDAFGRLDVLHICWSREDVLDDAGIDDAYRLAKQIENQKALALLPALLRELDALDDDARRVAVAQGILAGNIYDLGATSTINLHNAGRTDFHAVRSKLKPRPWFNDGLDDWCHRLDPRKHTPYRAAVLFVDNAGPDVTLGMLPLARELLKLGTTVVLTANTLPSLNDITHDELVPLVQHAADGDAVLREALHSAKLQLIPSGNRAPLIDLRRVSPDLAKACASLPVELVVLEGMGRGVESNYHAQLRCDTLNVAMIKDEHVAKNVGASMFDLVFKFQRA